MDYESIGRHVRNARLRNGFSQVEVAEKANLSPVHISHIETATTKASLPALVGIANALHVTMDELLSDVIYESKEVFKDRLGEVIADCNAVELGIITDIVVSVKESLRSRKYVIKHERT